MAHSSISTARNSALVAAVIGAILGLTAPATAQYTTQSVPNAGLGVYGSSNLDRNGAVLPGIEQSPGVAFPSRGVIDSNDVRTERALNEGRVDCGGQQTFNVRRDTSDTERTVPAGGCAPGVGVDRR